MINWMRREPIRARLVLLVVPLLIVLWTYAGSASFYRETFSTADRHQDLFAYMYHHAGSFVILGVGSLVVGLLLGWSPDELGWGFGNWRLGLLIVILIVPFVILPISFLSSLQDVFVQEYPVAEGALDNTRTFLLHSSVHVLYYLGWESFFRGFMLFGLEEECGAWTAILIQTIPSTIIHTSIVIPGKPFMETLGAIPFGIFAGWLAIRTRSFWYAFLIHAAMGIGLNLWIFI